jgi:hypothetical protein
MQITSEITPIDSTTRAIDFWFDNIFTDMSVRSIISDNREKLTDFCENMNSIINTLNKHMKDVKEQIIENERFACKVLCTTSVIDNGVNIKDETLKHIIIDYFDIDTIVQCLGRKRLLHKDDKINIYIRNRSSKSLKMSLTNFNTQIAQVKYLTDYGVEEFVKKYGRKDLSHCINIITDSSGHTNLKRNDIMYIKQLKNIETAELMIANNYDFIICEKLNIDYSTIKRLEDEYDALTLTDIISQYIGIKMFEEERNEFKKLLMDKLFNTPDVSHGSLGMKSINSLFKDNELDFIIKSKVEKSRKSENRDKTYWIISKL